MLSFSDASGNLFNRLGSIGYWLVLLRQFQDGLDTAMTDPTSGSTPQYASEADLQAQIGTAYQGSLSSAESCAFTAQQLAGNTINRMVFRDNPRIAQTLNSVNLTASLQEVIRQMQVAGATIQAQTVTATPSSFTGQGNGVLVASTRRYDGLVQENAYAEALLVSCSADSFSGGATAGNEGFTVTGTGAEPDPFAFDWPLGSNAESSLNAIDGESDNASGNLLTNSGFGEFTGGIPDNWTAVLGSGNFAQESTIVYDSATSALKITGNASGTLSELTQTFDLAAGTSGILDAYTQYALNVWMRRDGIAPAAGVLRFALIDGSGAIINDQAGNPCSWTVALTGLSTVYTAYNGFFRLPAKPPTTIKLQVKITTALTSGRSVYLDKMGMGTTTQVYSGGPALAVFAGSLPFVVQDYGTATIANNRGGQVNLASFGPLLQRWFDLASLDLLVPSSSLPTLSDSALIA